MFNEVAPQRTADAVFDQVRDQIVGGALVAGEALPGERELAAQLGVSRGVVRRFSASPRLGLSIFATAALPESVTFSLPPISICFSASWSNQMDLSMRECFARCWKCE